MGWRPPCKTQKVAHDWSRPSCGTRQPRPRPRQPLDAQKKNKKAKKKKKRTTNSRHSIRRQRRSSFTGVIRFRCGRRTKAIDGSGGAFRAVASRRRPANKRNMNDSVKNHTTRTDENLPPQKNKKKHGKRIKIRSNPIRTGHDDNKDKEEEEIR